MKQAILNLIRTSPNVRTVEISDKLDIDLDRVRPLIAGDIASGVIVEEPVIAPNGRTVLSFRFASAAPVAAAVAATLAPEPIPARVARTIKPASRAADQMPEKAQVHAPEQAVAAGDALATQFVMGAPQPAAKPGPADAAPEIDVPITRKYDVPLLSSATKLADVLPTPPRTKRTGPRTGPTRVELAIACLREAEGEPVPSEMLARAMGLPAKAHPASCLKDALHDGRVALHAKMWKLGPKAPPAPVETPAAVELPAPVVVVREPTQQERHDEGVAKLMASAKTAIVNVAADWVANAQPKEPVIVRELPSPADAAAEWVAAAEAEPLASVAPARAFESGFASERFTGGLPNIKTPYLPKAPELDIARNGLYENGEFRRPAHAIVDAAKITASDNLRIRTIDHNRVPAFQEPSNAPQFVAGVMSDGSLELRIPGKAPFDLPAEHARTLYEFMQAHGYAAWPKKQAA